MNKIAEFIKTNRKEAGLTQEEFAIRSGLGSDLSANLNRGKKLCVWTRSMKLLQCSAWRRFQGERMIDGG